MENLYLSPEDTENMKKLVRKAPNWELTEIEVAEVCGAFSREENHKEGLQLLVKMAAKAQLAKLAGTPDEQMVASLYWEQFRLTDYVGTEYKELAYLELWDGDFKTACQDFAKKVLSLLQPMISARVAQAKKEEGERIIGVIAANGYSKNDSLDLILPFKIWQELCRPLFIEGGQSLQGE